MRNDYKVIFYYSPEDKLYLSFAPELPGCCSDGETVQDALSNLDIVIDEWIETAKSLGREIPQAMSSSYESTKADIFAVSKYILEKTGTISTMTLEKLAYYCLVWSLVWYNKPLFNNKFRAWKKGPVCKELYDFHKGKRVISSSIISSSYELSFDEKKIVDCVLAVYGSENGDFLSELTHNERPWNETRGNLSKDDRCDKVIDNNLIRESYMY